MRAVEGGRELKCQQGGCGPSTWHPDMVSGVTQAVDFQQQRQWAWLCTHCNQGGDVRMECRERREERAGGGGHTRPSPAVWKRAGDGSPTELSPACSSLSSRPPPHSSLVRLSAVVPLVAHHRLSFPTSPSTRCLAVVRSLHTTRSSLCSLCQDAPLSFPCSWCRSSTIILPSRQ